MKVLIINGPNINMLGIREPSIYGNKTYVDLQETIKNYCKINHIQVELFQSNHEGELVDRIQQAYRQFDGIIINPAAYTHTSIAILDALKAVGIPSVEVHLSDIHLREDFRKISYVGLYCIASIAGKGFDGYLDAIELLKKRVGK